jgi:alpha-tubulin suppressor-like RCC1 family protein
MDVACGAYFTVAIDTLGRVWSVGDNRYGQLGRSSSEPPSTNKKSSKFDSCPRIIPNLDYENVKYDKVTCGVSHAVLHGVTLEGENVFVALGRSDMGQYPRKESNSGDMLLWRLKPLPKPSTTIGNQSVREDWMGDIAHVWCGSEFIYACDYSGYLYSAGWGDHGNLGSVDVNVNPPTSSLVQDNSDMNEEGKHSGVALTNGCVLEWAPVLVEPSPGYLPSLNSSEATTCTVSHVCLGEYSSSSSVSCGGGHTLIKITKKMHAE